VHLAAGAAELPDCRLSVTVGATKDDVSQSGSLRIIYLGATGGPVRFREAWVQGTQITKSIDRNFDQFAKAIEIVGFKYDVVEVKSDKVKLRRGPKSSGTRACATSAYPASVPPVAVGEDLVAAL